MENPGGSEVELSLLFADVRGSTKMAEHMSAGNFSRIMMQFYKAATDVLIKTDAFIDNIVGDEVVGLYFPLFTGPNHAAAAIHAAEELLRVIGYGTREGAWLPIGIGVNTGVAYVGTVCGSEGTVSDVTALGDAVNVTARLASLAGPGEAFVSDTSVTASGLNFNKMEHRQLELKGKSDLVGVRVIKKS